METKAAKKKKTGTKEKKESSARQDKKSSIRRNINAALDAVAKYSTKKAR
jgi:hypothetical protein